jgi:KDO2-lipid IV(A) lauroyltransferase
MEWLLYALARGGIALVQALPLPTVVRLGRWGGALVYHLDARHRGVALLNLDRCLGSEKSAEEIRAIARENFRRIGENFSSAVKTAAMTDTELEERIEVVGTERLSAAGAISPKSNRVVAIGHFGNFELYARLGRRLPGLQLATTYRSLRQPSLNRLLQSLREQSGCRYFERRADGEALRAAMHEGGLVLGLLADQHGGRRGVWGPFFGRECSTNPAPAVLALRYKCPLHTGICFRVAPARWRIEIGEEIPTHEAGRARPVETITNDINIAFEAAIRRDPANWFWVHRRWKARGRETPAPSTAAVQSRPEGV